MKNGCYGVQAPDDDAEIERQMRGPSQGYSGAFKDDLTGQVLKDDLVRAARAAELTYFHSKKVWNKVPRSRARERTGRAPISVRWVDVNKGDDIQPNYRSRLVAGQLNIRLGLVGVDLRIEVRTLDVHKTDLNPRLGAGTPIWLVVASPRHSHADDST